MLIGKGRPALEINLKQLTLLMSEGYTAKEISEVLKCSKTVVYKTCYANGLQFRAQYSQLSDAELYEHIQALNIQYTNSGFMVICKLIYVPTYIVNFYLIDYDCIFTSQGN